ncbi:hypothetical protein X777_11751 [Ooceraea biroi]|uniref:Uncharacterized protein n=1 Tax=Ooceraea biroi TaxID=2015173 RepID=A0A026W1B9_OOCBI|nr:hypothetical protein X777_11751 [Ooceraea biroi]
MICKIIVFSFRWPGLKNVWQKDMRKRHLNFQKLFKARVQCMKELRHFLTQVGGKYYCNSDSNECSELYMDKDYSRLGIFDPWNHYMDVIVNEEDLNLLLHPNETTHHLYYYLFMDELKSLHERSQSEEIITFVTQWFNPEIDIFYSDMEKELDQIAQDVMEYLKIENFRHPIFKISQEQFSVWKRNDLDQDQWDNCDAIQILDILVKIFFHKLKYHEIILSGTVNIIRNYLIEKNVYIVPVAILFQSIARRLGIRCDLLFS